MQVTRLYTGDDDRSHFEDIELELKDFGGSGHMSEPWPARSVVFREVSGDYDWSFHNAPRRQFIVNLTGSVEIELRRRNQSAVRPRFDFARGGRNRPRPHLPCGGGRTAHLFGHSPWRRMMPLCGWGKWMKAISRSALACGALALVVWAAPALAVEAGEPAPPFTLPAVEAEAAPIVLADYRGKVLYLEFWSSWCAPCRRSMPQLDAVRANWPQEKFEVVGLNLDTAPPRCGSLP